MIRYCECRTHADGDSACGRQAAVKVTLKTCSGVQGPFFYCSDCAGGLADPGDPGNTSVVKIEKLVDPNAPTLPAFTPVGGVPLCPECSAMTLPSEEKGWRVCPKCLTRFQVDEESEPV